MRQPSSGTTLPKTTFSWAVADQTLASNTSYAPTHIACQGARVAGGIVVAIARGALPRTAGPGSCDPTVVAYCDADDFVTLRISNNNAAALAPLTTALVFDLMFFPLDP